MIVAQHDIHTIYGGNFVWFELRITPRNGNYGIRVAAVYFTDYIAAFFVGVLGDRTAVDNRNIGLLVSTHADKSALLELSGDGRTLREVEFATERMKIYLPHQGTKIVKN